MEKADDHVTKAFNEAYERLKTGASSPCQLEDLETVRRAYTATLKAWKACRTLHKLDRYDKN